MIFFQVIIMKVKIMSKDRFKIIDLNRRKAIHERCLNCSCWIPKEVSDCRFTDCPLSDYRTGKGKQNPKKRREFIRKYCLSCMNSQHSEVKKCVSSTCPLFSYRLRQVDRTQEINSDVEKEHIEAISEDKTEQSISLYG